MKISAKRLKEIIKEEIVKEFTTTGTAAGQRGKKNIDKSYALDTKHASFTQARAKTDAQHQELSKIIDTQPEKSESESYMTHSIGGLTPGRSFYYTPSNLKGTTAGWGSGDVFTAIPAAVGRTNTFGTRGDKTFGLDAVRNRITRAQANRDKVVAKQATKDLTTFDTATGRNPKGAYATPKPIGYEDPIQDRGGRWSAGNLKQAVVGKSQRKRTTPAWTSWNTDYTAASDLFDKLRTDSDAAQKAYDIAKQTSEREFRKGPPPPGKGMKNIGFGFRGGVGTGGMSAGKGYGSGKSAGKGKGKGKGKGDNKKKKFGEIYSNIVKDVMTEINDIKDFHNRETKKWKN